MIVKCAAIVIWKRRLLVVRKYGTSVFISPGGKIEKGETQLECLRRELHEEVGLYIDSAEHFGTFKRRSPFESDDITVHSWIVTAHGNIEPRAEIEQVMWLRGKDMKGGVPVASVFAKDVIPELCKKGLIDD